MPESPERLLQRIRLGEDSSIELKEPEYRLLGDTEVLLTIHAAAPETGDSTGADR